MQKRERHQVRRSQQQKGNTEKKSEMSSQPAEEQLPRETIECMKIAMQELIDQKLDPIEHKLNQLLDTKKLQVEQQTELNKVKTAQSELYRKCIKIENENNKLKARLETLECKMLDGNVILHGLREDAWELEEIIKKKCIKPSPQQWMKKMKMKK